ncbi:unnamed protein product, partial [Symbiodinium necroappetens]
ELVDKTCASKAAGPAPGGQAAPKTPPRPPLKRKRQDGPKPRSDPPDTGAAAEPATSSAEARPADGPGATTPPRARPGEGKKRKKKETSRGTRTASLKSLLQIPPAAGALPDYQPLARGPREYGTWLEIPSDTFEERPWALVLFSGRRRKGDLPNWLVHFGFMVCCIDLVADHPCNALDEAQWTPLEKDVNDGHFEVVWAGTVCGTFSPHAKEANVLVERTFDILSLTWDERKTWGLENPVHGSDRPELWQMPLVRQLSQLDRTAEAVFDQCRFGLATVKPTKVLYSAHAKGLEEVRGLRCDHPRGTHGTVAGQREQGASGAQWASKGQGQYTPHFAQVEELIAFPKDKTDRERENAEALGGMRNPRAALSRLPRSRRVRRAIHKLLRHTLAKWPELVEPARAILRGEEPSDFDTATVDSSAVHTVLGRSDKVKARRRTAPAETPLRADSKESWNLATEDPDAATLANWLDNGAPLGISQAIPSRGVFPKVSSHNVTPHSQLDARTLEGWSNYQSAEEEAETLEELISDYVARGFCQIAYSQQEAEEVLGGKPVLNKLGVLVKEKRDAHGKVVKKARVIWDLRESSVNKACHQGERIILPRLWDVVASALASYRRGRPPYLAGVDIKDAFMNIPAGADRRFTVAAVPGSRNRPGKRHRLIIFNTLVFGSASSPTIWGRAAAWLGRTSAAVSPADLQCYVDDPIYVLEGPSAEAAAGDLSVILLWTAVCGYPIKLSKATGGKELEWVGAKIRCLDAEEAVVVTLPEAKIQALLADTNRFLSKPVAGARELRSYTGALSFVAGLVPHLRPFLASFWSVLSRHAVTSEGLPVKEARKLIHVRRIRPALRWVRALLSGGPTIEKIFYARPPRTDLEIVTDASPWGIGGVRRHSGKPTGYFYSHLPDGVLKKFGAERGLPKHNTLWEGLALLVAFRLWLPALVHGALFRAKSDNLGFLKALAKGSAKAPDLNVLAREFAYDQAV